MFQSYIVLLDCAANGSKYCYILCSHVPNRLLLLFLFVYNKRVGFEIILIIVIIVIIVSISSANQLNIGKRIVSLKWKEEKRRKGEIKSLFLLYSKSDKSDYLLKRKVIENNNSYYHCQNFLSLKSLKLFFI